MKKDKSLNNFLIQLLAFVLIFFILLITYYLLFIKDINKLPPAIVNNRIFKRIMIKYLVSDERRGLYDILKKSGIDSPEAILNSGEDDYLFSSSRLYNYLTLNGVSTYIHKSGITELSIRFPLKDSIAGKIDFISIQVPYNAGLEKNIRNFGNMNIPEKLKRYFDVSLSNFDSLGLRETGLADSGNLPVIFVAGDSYMEGLYVNDDETFVYYLARLMDRDRYAFPYNGGVNGYSPEKEKALIEQYALKVNSRALILNHSAGDVATEDEDIGPFLDNILDRGKTEALWKENNRQILEIKRFCADNRMIFIIALFPDKDYYKIKGRDVRIAYHDKIIKFCSENGIFCIDPYYDAKSKLDEIEGKNYKEKGNSIETISQNELWGNEFYIPWDRHLSSQGNKWYAGFLYEKIKGKYPEIAEQNSRH